MARSIHATHQQLAQARRNPYADAARKTEDVRRLRRALRHKRHVKAQVRCERHTPGLPPAEGCPVAIEAIPIVVAPAGGQERYVHHPASPQDLREVLRALPPGVADGLSSVVLTLGRHRQEKTPAGDRVDYAKPDPLVGRVGFEVFAGVYAGRYLGIYRPDANEIWLFAYVYDLERLPLPRPQAEFYLRLRVLTTFVHEVAHHFDERRRVARGRWLATGTERVERYAEGREHAWTQKVIVPFLERRYPEETRALGEWIAHHGGIEVPLATLAGEPRTMAKGGKRRRVVDAGHAFEDWLDELASAPDLTAARLAFAWKLHFADHFELCLTATEALLTRQPFWVEALTLQADTLNHLERWDEAEEVARRALVVEPGHLPAWAELGWACEGRGDWPGLLANAEHRLALVEAGGDPGERFSALRHRAVAHCGSENLTAVEDWLRAWDAALPPRPGRVEGMRHTIYQRAGGPLPA